jgi:O-acetyl-ADP-ribose deacetylase (regulator of RNase III)
MVDGTCFVIMPFGRKKDIDGKEIDFNQIYEQMIRKAVGSIAGLKCIRCDDIEEPGWVHERMLTHIVEDRVAIVDTSTLNANVFYELGVRHAVRKGVAVLIHRQGTTWPFNIAGMNSIEYRTTPKGMEEARTRIASFIANALNNPKSVDSLVHLAVRDLRVAHGPARVEKQLTKVEAFEFPLADNPDRRIGLVTGDREHIKVGDVWVNSENTDMQMDRYYGKSTSATIRYLGARKSQTGRIEEDTIGEALTRELRGEKSVHPTSVIATEAGSLRENNNVKWIFHVASVVGEPREGYRPIEAIERCVTKALQLTEKAPFHNDALGSILFPIFGTGPGGGPLEVHAERCVNAAINYLESNAESPVRVVYFYAWSDVALETCKAVVQANERLRGGT